VNTRGPHVWAQCRLLTKPSIKIRLNSATAILIVLEMFSRGDKVGVSAACLSAKGQFSVSLLRCGAADT
jgi:hypothetical protein